MKWRGVKDAAADLWAQWESERERESLWLTSRWTDWQTDRKNWQNGKWSGVSTITFDYVLHTFGVSLLASLKIASLGTLMTHHSPLAAVALLLGRVIDIDASHNWPAGSLLCSPLLPLLIVRILPLLLISPSCTKRWWWWWWWSFPVFFLCAHSCTERTISSGQQLVAAFRELLLLRVELNWLLWVAFHCSQEHALIFNALSQSMVVFHHHNCHYFQWWWLLQEQLQNILPTIVCLLRSPLLLIDWAELELSCSGTSAAVVAAAAARYGRSWLQFTI